MFEAFWETMTVAKRGMSALHNGDTADEVADPRYRQTHQLGFHQTHLRILRAFTENKPVPLNPLITLHFKKKG